MAGAIGSFREDSVSFLQLLEVWLAAHLAQALLELALCLVLLAVALLVVHLANGSAKCTRSRAGSAKSTAPDRSP